MCVCVCVLGTAGLLVVVRLESKIMKLKRDRTSVGETSVVPCQQGIQKVEEGEGNNDRWTKVDADTKCV